MTDGPWTQYATNAGAGNANAAPAAPSTYAQRGQAVATGPMAMRSIAGATGRILGQQERLGSTELALDAPQIMQLHYLGQARRIVDSGTHTGPAAPAILWGERALGNFGLNPNSDESTRLGTLQKDAGLLAQNMNSSAGETDQASRAAVRNDAVFDITKDTGTNRQNINSLTRNVVGQMIQTQVRQLWRRSPGLGDENAADPRSGLTAAQVSQRILSQLPDDAAQYEIPSVLAAAMRVQTPHGTLDLSDAMGPTIGAITRTMAGSGDFPTPSTGERVASVLGGSAMADRVHQLQAAPRAAAPSAVSAAPTAVPPAAARALLAGAGTDTQFDQVFGQGAAARVRAQASGQAGASR